jgi:hypothetical protein
LAIFAIVNKYSIADPAVVGHEGLNEVGKADQGDG